MTMKKYCIIYLMVLSAVLIGLCAFDCTNHLWLAAIIWTGWFLLTVCISILESYTTKYYMKYDSAIQQNEYNKVIKMISQLNEQTIKDYQKQIEELRKELEAQYEK